MTTPTLPDQLRALVDQVEAPTFADIRVRAATAPQHRNIAPRRRVVVALAAALAIVVAAAAIVALVRDGNGPSRHVEPAVTTGNAELPPGCLVTATTSRGCLMGPDKAAKFLGFQPRTPSGIPHGWVKVRSRLWVFRDRLPDVASPLTAGADHVGMYVQIWAPRGEDLSPSGTCPNYLVVRETAPLAGEGTTAERQTIDLGDGTVAVGNVEKGRCAGEVHDSATLGWTSDAEYVGLEGRGIARDQMLAIARSIDR
jgi:hypothetical protein